MLDKIQSKLNFYGYMVSVKEDSLTVKLTYGLVGKIKFDDDRIKIKGYFVRWNILTGLLNLNIKWLVLYNSLWLAFFVFIQLYFRSDTIDLPYLPFIFLAWFLMFTIYYYVVYYSFKSMVIGLIDRIK